MRISPRRFTAALLAAGLLASFPLAVCAAPAGSSSANIDQARNGTSDAPISPVHFQNGNAGAQNSHYLEGFSIPYRVRLDGLTLGTHQVTIGWDIRQSGKNALDYITGPDRLQPHAQFLPSHSAEVVDPLEALVGSFSGPTPFAIPAPVAVLSGQPLASFNALPASERKMMIYNGNITGMVYVVNADGNMGNLSAAASESRMKITFNATSSSVVLAFGGHIASQADWGAGKSASAINGSPYHARVISLDNTSIGNQDRSLSTDAVLGCNITGPSAGCSYSVQKFSETTNKSGASYLWAFTANSSGATFVGSNTGSSVNVNAGQAVAGTEGFTLQVKITAGRNAVSCSAPFTVYPVPVLEIAGDPIVCPDGVRTYTGPSGMSSYHWSVSGGSIQGSAYGQSVTVKAGHLCDGTMTVTLDVMNGGGCGGHGSKSVAVQDKQPPVFHGVGGPLTIECPASPAFSSPSADDDCGGYVELKYYDERSAGRCANEYSVTRTWTAKDACGNASTASQVINVVDHTAPVIAALPAASTIECPAAPVFAVAYANDACDANPRLGYEDATTPGNCAGQYSVTRTWTATDACGNSSTGSQVIHVVDHTAPVIAELPAASTLECPATPEFAVAYAHDACDANPRLDYKDVTTPGDCAGQYSVTRTWTATDACGNSSTASQVINFVDHTAPVIAELPAMTTVECSGTPEFAVAHAHDACDANPRLDYKDVTTSGDCAGQYSVTRTWTATDACGNNSTASQVINFVDHTAPVIAALPAESTIECPATPTFAVAYAHDACDANARLDYKDVTTEGDCAGRYSVTRTWTAADACGNTSTASQTINVADRTGPVVACQADTTVGACQNPVWFSIHADDACGGPVSIVATPPSGSTFPIGDHIVNVVARDACGNESRCSFHVHVMDNPAGEIAGPPSVCSGQSATLTGPAGFDYLWSTGETTQSIVVSASATYTLRITDHSTRCSAMLSHALGLTPPPVASISGPGQFCDGTKSQLCGPSGNFTYLWTGPAGFQATTQCIDVTASASYQLVITDKASGCRSAAVTQAVNATACNINCPHTIGWWMAQCADKNNGSSKYTSAQLAQIFSCVDGQVAIFNWSDDVAGFCSTINPASVDQRTQAKRQFAGFVANICTSQLGITAWNGEQISISLVTPVTFAGFTAHTIGDLVAEADQKLVALESQQLKKAGVQTQYSQITSAFDDLNNNRIPGSSCPASGVASLSGNDPTNAAVSPGAQESIAGAQPPMGSELRLYTPSPNPFTGHTRFAYAVGTGGESVDLAVFDLAGRRIRQIASGFQPAGRHEAEWDGKSESGQLMQGGVYFIRARVGQSMRVIPLVHMK